MARKKAPEKHANHERWLVSYGDFVTLLFAVFVTLYAMSQTDKQKVDELVASMRESFGIAQTARKPSVLENSPLVAIPSLKPQVLAPGMGKRNPFPPKAKMTAAQKDLGILKQALDKALKESGAAEKASVEVTRRGLVVSLREAGFFTPGSRTLSAEGTAQLDKIASTLTRFANPIRVEGHTDDSVPPGGDRENWEISALRAVNVLAFLVNNWMFDPETSSVAGFGSYHPEYPNDTPENKAKNRRVDIILLSPESAAMELNRQ